MVAPNQVDARQTFEFLASNTAQQVSQPEIAPLMANQILYNDNIAYRPYLATPERLEQIIRFGDYVSLFLTFTGPSQRMNEVSAAQQLIVVPLVVLNMINEYISWMIPILRCRHQHVTQTPTSFDRGPPPPPPSAALTFPPMQHPIHSPVQAHNHRDPRNPMATFGYPPPTPPVVNYYQPPVHPYNQPFPSVQNTPTRMPDMAITTMAPQAPAISPPLQFDQQS